MKENNWLFQWNHYINDENIVDDDFHLFNDWIRPVTLEDFTGKTALDCGCGRGQHLSFLIPYISRAVGVDLNTVQTAQKYVVSDKVQFISDNIATMSLGEQFDIVYSIGVLQHTDDPGSSFTNIKKHLKSGGRLIIWVYAWEGNFINRILLEPLTRHFFSKLSRTLVLNISFCITCLLYGIVYSLYLPPLRFLPFYEYFLNFRKMKFAKNRQNVFDKLNAPQTRFLKRETMEQWFNDAEFSQVVISPYAGVSWRATGIRR